MGGATTDARAGCSENCGRTCVLRRNLYYVFFCRFSVGWNIHRSYTEQGDAKCQYSFAADSCGGGDDLDSLLWEYRAVAFFHCLCYCERCHTGYVSSSTAAGFVLM